MTHPESPAPLQDRDNPPAPSVFGSALAYGVILIGLAPTLALLPELFGPTEDRSDVARTLLLRLFGATVIIGGIYVYGSLRSGRMKRITATSGDAVEIFEGIWDAKSFRGALGRDHGFSIRTYVVVFRGERVDFWQGFRKPHMVASLETRKIQDLYGSSSSEHLPAPVLRVKVAGRVFDLLLLESSEFLIKRIRPQRLVVLARTLRGAINKRR